MELEEMSELIKTQNRKIMDLEAERDSLKTENEKLLETHKQLESDLKETKELNFTLARQVNREPAKTTEQILSEMF